MEWKSANQVPGSVELGYEAYLGAFHTLNSRIKFGKNIYSEPWDALILLDACRVDALRAIAPEYEFIDDVDAIWSRGSGSHEFFARTFTQSYRHEIQNTVLTTPNGFAERLFRDSEYPPTRDVPFCIDRRDAVSADDFQLLDTPWLTHQREYDIVLPRVMTDRSIHLAREQEPARFVVQYYQPHKPYLFDAVPEGRATTTEERNPFLAVQNGDMTKDRLWEMYLSNLRFVLDEVEILLENLDAERVVLTADHGEALGDMGLWGHQEGLILKATRRVPWVEMTATDTKTHDPSSENLQHIGVHDRSTAEVAPEEVESRLNALGYR